MRTWILSLLVVLSGCAHVGQDAASTGRVAALLNDAAFTPPAARIDTDDLFALSPDMRSHLNSMQFRALVREHGQTYGLMHALYDPRELQLDYDATHTGTAAETYAARKGNCLSLVIMTAAFARAMNMNVRCRQVPQLKSAGLRISANSTWLRKWWASSLSCRASWVRIMPVRPVKLTMYPKRSSSTISRVSQGMPFLQRRQVW